MVNGPMTLEEAIARADAAAKNACHVTENHLIGCAAFVNIYRREPLIFLAALLHGIELLEAPLKFLLLFHTKCCIIEIIIQQKVIV